MEYRQRSVTFLGIKESFYQLLKKHIESNARQAQNQAEYQQQYDKYSERFEKLTAKHDELIAKKTILLGRADSFRLFIGVLKKQNEAITEFDDRLWQTTIKQVKVNRDGTMVFEFYNGTEILI